jgi:hypothetical protein
LEEAERRFAELDRLDFTYVPASPAEFSRILCGF